MLESASQWGDLVPGGVCSGGCLLRGDVCSGGGLVWGGVCSGGGYGPRGGISQHALRQTPLVDRQTSVKILPWPNFVAAGKNIL